MLDHAALWRVAEAIEADEARITLTIARTRRPGLAATSQTALLESAIRVSTAHERYTLAFDASVAPLAVIICDTNGRISYALPLDTHLALTAVLRPQALDGGRHAHHVETDLTPSTFEVAHTHAVDVVDAPPVETNPALVAVRIHQAHAFDGRTLHLETDLPTTTLAVGGAGSGPNRGTDPVFAGLASGAIIRGLAGARATHAVFAEIAGRTRRLTGPVRHHATAGPVTAAHGRRIRRRW